MTEANVTQALDWPALTGEYYWVDIGSRGGFHEMTLLHPMVHMYSVDADAAIEPKLQKFASFHHFPLALHSSEGEAELFLTKRPGMSSLLEVDDAAFTRHFGLMPGSASWREALAATHKQKTRTQRADDFFLSQDLERIDFLKLDTQGTELEILRGAHEYLRAGRISVIKTEVSFIPVYRNQCTFSEIDQFLKTHGFVFVDCMFYPDAVHAPDPARAVSDVNLQEQVRFSSGGDAIYALNPLKHAGDDRDTSTVRSAILLNQMGYVSLAFDLLKGCGYATDFAEKVLRVTAACDRKATLKRLLKRHLSPWAYQKVQKLGRRLSSAK